MTKDKGTKPTVYLVDGSNYIYRAFYAIRELTNSRGFPTNAIYGFTTMLMKLRRDYKPDYIAIFFDSRGPTFRHEMYEEYKANRKAMPDELAAQIPAIKDVVYALAVPGVEKEGVEADDAIGTAVRSLAGSGVRTVIVSGDKDLMQLVSEDVTMIDTMKDKTYDVAAVKERFGVAPAQVVEVLGLAGDTSDNVPGVPGIGEKTAAKLVREYGGVEAVIAHADTVKNKRVRENLTTYADQARLSRELVVIKTDVDIPCTLEDFSPGKENETELKRLFTEFEFSSLIQKMKVEEENGEGDYRIAVKKADIETLIDECREASGFAVDVLLTEPEAMRASVMGIAVTTAEKTGWYVSLRPEMVEGCTPDDVVDVLKPLLEDKGVVKHGYDLKTAYLALSRLGIETAGLATDVMIAAYVLNPSRRTFDFLEIAREHLGREMKTVKDMVHNGSRKTALSDLPLETVARYTCRRSDYALRLCPILNTAMEKAGLADLFRSIEMALLPVLARMERRGVLVDAAILTELSERLEAMMETSQRKIYAEAGAEFNINSPKQLQTVLFEKMGLPRGKKTKAGYSTDSEVLENLAHFYTLPAEILVYRRYAKLKSTYADVLPQLIHPETGRIHTSYNQTVTATGRLSSSNPNLQNIPIRTEEGARIRQAFVPPAGWRIISADYSQIELRILAHLSGDETLIRAFTADEDIHTRTASDVFGVFPEMVNRDMRRQAKVINFGIIYGMSPFGLARELGITQKLAKTYIDEYFHKYDGVKRYIDGMLEKTKKEKYAMTLFGRRRYIADMESRNGAIRQFAERTAINTPIQGTAADIIKIAMVNIDRRLTAEGFSARMIMQVHDELVLEVPAKECDTVEALVREEMEGVMDLSVPLKVEIGRGGNWDEAH